PSLNVTVECLNKDVV
ncbi:hypothetical protein PybrP1_000299, partial [[Pythium] brassicae (nom. inval.)]